MKKFFVFALLACFLFSALTAYADVATVIRMESDYAFIPTTVYPGDLVTMSVNFKNYSDGTPAENVLVNINPSNHFESVIFDENLGAIKPGETKTANFQFRVREDTVPSSYKIPVTMNYLNERRGNEISDTDSIALAIASSSRVDIKNISLSTPHPYVGEELILSAVVENTGSVELRDVKLKLEGAFSNFVLLSDTQFHLANIPVTGSQIVRFILKPTEDTVPGIYTFDLNASFLGSTEIEKEKVSIEVKGRSNLIISGIDFSIEGRAKDKRILQGDAFSLSIQLDNIGEYKAKAVSLTLESEEGIVGTKEAFVGNIDEDDSGAAVFDLSALASAKIGDQKITVAIEFINELGEKEELKKSLDFFIHEKPPESPLGLIISIAVLFAVLYFFVKMVFRQLAIRKASRV